MSFEAAAEAAAAAAQLQPLTDVSAQAAARLETVASLQAAVDAGRGCVAAAERELALCVARLEGMEARAQVGHRDTFHTHESFVFMRRTLCWTLRVRLCVCFKHQTSRRCLGVLQRGEPAVLTSLACRLTVPLSMHTRPFRHPREIVPPAATVMPR